MHCNAVTTAARAYRPGDDPWAQVAAPGAPAPRIRQDGWTPLRQQVFLRSIAEGATVELACAGVGLSPQSAYAFRNRASGAAFALGWAAARLLGRERFADTLLTRALEGQIETVTRPDGTTVDRLKYDNRLAMGLLARLDRQAEANHAGAQAARLVAQEFEAFTDAIGRDDSPARAGLFLGTRALGEPEAELAPVIALARADRFARTGAGLAAEVDTSDLDLARRADWTADQWQRAEAAGLISFSPPCDQGGAGGGSDNEPDSASPPQLPQLPDDVADYVWQNAGGEWRTEFAPPDDFDGDEEGTFGALGYHRSLTPAEQDAVDRMLADELAEGRAWSAQIRDLFFGFVKEEEEESLEPLIPSEVEEPLIPSEACPEPVEAVEGPLASSEVEKRPSSVKISNSAPPAPAQPPAAR
jgi:hypothetical protein